MEPWKIRQCHNFTTTGSKGWQASRPGACQGASSASRAPLLPGVAAKPCRRPTAPVVSAVLVALGVRLCAPWGAPPGSSSISSALRRGTMASKVGRSPGRSAQHSLQPRQRLRRWRVAGWRGNAGVGWWVGRPHGRGTQLLLLLPTD